jgi:hypothetical protein
MDTGCSFRQEALRLVILPDLNIAVASPEEEAVKKEEI